MSESIPLSTPQLLTRPDVMATRSAIGYALPSGKVRAVYGWFHYAL